MVKILIADDASFQRKLLKQMLAEGGYTDVIEAGSQKEAMTKCKTSKPDLMTLDVIMGEETGENHLVQFKKLCPNMKIIVVTVVDQESVREKLMNAGADAYLTKPLDSKQLLTTIKKLLVKK